APSRARAGARPGPAPCPAPVTSATAPESLPTATPPRRASASAELEVREAQHERLHARALEAHAQLLARAGARDREDRARSEDRVAHAQAGLEAGRGVVLRVRVVERRARGRGGARTRRRPARG